MIPAKKLQFHLNYSHCLQCTCQPWLNKEKFGHMRKECLLNSHDTKQNIEAHNEQYNIDKALIFNKEISRIFNFSHFFLFLGSTVVR